MYSRDMRPFQPVVYVTKCISDRLEWKGRPLEDLFTFSELAKALGDDEIITFLQLNSDTKETENALGLPLPLGTETLMRSWYQEVAKRENGNLKDIIDDIDRQFKLRKVNSALKKALAKENDEVEIIKNAFDIVHSERYVFVVLNKEECNLLDNRSIEEIIPNLSREIVKTYCIYHDYRDVSTNPWFRLYLENLQM